MDWLKHPVVIALGIAIVAVGLGKVLTRLTTFYHPVLPFLYAAYTLSFIAFFFYLRSIDARAEAVKKDIENLRKEIAGRK